MEATTTTRRRGIQPSWTDRQIGFIEDVNESSYMWDFVLVPNRLFRVSIIKVTHENAGTDLVHLKVIEYQSNISLAINLYYLYHFKKMKTPQKYPPLSPH